MNIEEIEEKTILRLESVSRLIYPLHNCVNMAQRDTPQQRKIVYERVYKIAEKKQKERGFKIELIVVKNESDKADMPGEGT